MFGVPLSSVNKKQKAIMDLTEVSSIQDRDQGNQEMLHSEINCIIKEESEKF